jgi:hypothetical protein
MIHSASFTLYRWSHIYLKTTPPHDWCGDGRPARLSNNHETIYIIRYGGKISLAQMKYSEVVRHPLNVPEWTFSVKSGTSTLWTYPLSLWSRQFTKQRLPDIVLWDIGADHGWTLTHEAVRRGHLPEGFDHWDWADKDGRTVAHAAAECGNLPDDFNHLDWIDKEGRTVADVVAGCNYFHVNRHEYGRRDPGRSDPRRSDPRRSDPLDFQYDLKSMFGYPNP